MKTIIVNGKDWKTRAGRASYENIAFIMGFDPEEQGLTITYRAKIKMNVPGSKKEDVGSYEGTLTKNNDCVIIDQMVFNVSRI